MQPNSLVDVNSIPQKTVSGYAHPRTDADFFRIRLLTLLGTYFLLDLIAIIMMSDPFWIVGPDVSHELPASLQRLSPWALMICREVISIIAIWAAILAFFSLSDVVQFCIAKVFFPARALLWNYPSVFGSLSEIPERGLSGFWGSWWHQSFRLDFLGPSTYLLNNGHVKKGTLTADLVGLFVSFFQSGLIHAAGSASTVPLTRPLRSFWFFMLQGLGVLVQGWLAGALRAHGPPIPRPVRRATNVLVTLAWLIATAPLFLKDVASAGLWLLEPVPVSPLRYMGYGFPDDHWWRWERDFWPKVYPAQHWYEVGISL